LPLHESNMVCELSAGSVVEELEPRTLFCDDKKKKAERVFTFFIFSLQTARLLPAIMTAFQLGAIYLD